MEIDDDDWFSYHCWRNNVLIAFGPFSSFLAWVSHSEWRCLRCLSFGKWWKTEKDSCRSSVIGVMSYPPQYPRSSNPLNSSWPMCLFLVSLSLSVCMCIFAMSVVWTKEVSWALVHADVYIPHVFLTLPYIFATQSFQGVHMRSCVRSSFIRVGKRGWEGSSSLCGALVAWRRVLFLTEGEIEMLSCVLSVFWRGCECTCVYVCMCVCAHAHTHTHCTRGARCEPRGRDERLGEPEESRWTKSRQICISICVEITHVCIYVGRRDEIWTNSSFSLTYPFFWKSKAKDVNVKPRTRMKIKSEQHRPSIKGTKLLIVI